MRSTKRLLLSVSILVLICSTLSFADDDVEFGGDVNFLFQDEDGNNVFDNMIGNLFLEYFPVLDVSTSSFFIGAETGSWRDPLSWDAGYNIINYGLWTKKVFDIYGDIKELKPISVYLDLNELDCLLNNSGPTERSIGFTYNVPLAGSGDPDVDKAINDEKLKIGVSASVPLRFNAIISSDTVINMDQSDVTLEGLTIKEGGHLIGNPTMLIRNDLINLGKISNLSGIIEGNFNNNSLVANGGGANITDYLRVDGELNNTGDIRIESGLLNLVSETSNAGSISVEDGELNYVGGLTNLGIGTISLNDGEISGNSDLVNYGNFIWSSGRIGGNVTNESSTFEIVGDSAKIIKQNGNLSNSGTITQTGTGMLGFWSGGELNNLVDGLYDIQSDAYLFGYSTDGGQINNEGTFRKSGGVESVIGARVAFHNTGTVEVLSGTLKFGGGGSSQDGIFFLSNGSRLLFSDDYEDYSYNSSQIKLYGENIVTGFGTFEIGGADVQVPSQNNATLLSSSGSYVDISAGSLKPEADAILTLNTSTNGQFRLMGGTLGGYGTVINKGNFEWSSGYIGGNITNESSTFEIVGDSAKIIKQNGNLSNSGTVTQTGTGMLGFWPGGELNNLVGGLYDIQSDAYIFGYSTEGGKIYNEGTFCKSGGEGESLIGPHVAFYNTGTVEVQSGTLSFTGGYTQTEGATILNGGAIKSTTPFNIIGGTVEGTGEIVADILNEAGFFSPGFSPGVLTVNGDYTQGSNGTLLIEIADLNPGLYDVLNVTGTAYLDGLLDIKLLDGFVPQIGDTFEILNFSSYTGMFSSINGFNLGDGKYFEVQYSENGISLNTEVIPAPGASLLGGIGVGFLLRFRNRRPL